MVPLIRWRRDSRRLTIPQNVPEEAVTTAFNQHRLSVFGGEDNVVVDLGEGGQANPLCTAWATPGGSMGCGKRLVSTG